MNKDKQNRLIQEVARLRTAIRIAEAGWAWSEADYLRMELDLLLDKLERRGRLIHE